MVGEELTKAWAKLEQNRSAQDALLLCAAHAFARHDYQGALWYLLAANASGTTQFDAIIAALRLERPANPSNQVKAVASLRSALKSRAERSRFLYSKVIDALK